MKKILTLVLLVMLLSMPVHAQEDNQTYTQAELLQMWEQLIPMMREAECYPYVVLQQGDRGYEVIFLQTRLAELLYYSKEVDPQFGRGTLAAMKAFERVHGLPINGIASVADQQLLFSSKAKMNEVTHANPSAKPTKSPGNNLIPTTPNISDIVDKLATVTPTLYPIKPITTLNISDIVNNLATATPTLKLIQPIITKDLIIPPFKP